MRKARCAVLLVMAWAALAAIAWADNMSVNTTQRDVIRGCDDIEVTFDGHAAARAEQQLTEKSMALRVHAAHNGGIALDTWEKDEFGITVCKAAADASDLAAINASLQGGDLTAEGPNHGQWTAYLLIHAPRGASVEADSHNGGIRLHRAIGTFRLNSQNGPISIKESAGTIEATAQNGPISYVQGSMEAAESSTKAYYNGENLPKQDTRNTSVAPVAGAGGGNLQLTAHNGPISIKLVGTRWTGGALQASTHNGPLHLDIPANYESAALVETDGHSPISCRGGACDKAQKNWDEERRMLRFGSGEPVIKLSTHNGPVSVRSGGEGREDSRL